MTRKKPLGRTLLALVMCAAMGGTAIADDACPPEVQSVIDKQRESYIQAYSDLASQNFSKRPGTFASTTCLDNLMKGGGMDIFFKPPSLDNILNMVMNLACEQASQIFNQVMGGSGLNGGGSLNPGEILPGIRLGGMSGTSRLASSGGSSGISVSPSFKDLFR